jgi:hypothetical protein
VGTAFGLCLPYAHCLTVFSSAFIHGIEFIPENYTMPIEKFQPTKFLEPSLTYKGEVSPEHIYVGVGRALHCWEHMESALIRLFQVLCESRSIAACRAYGMIESSFTKHQVLRQASEAFFGAHQPFDKTNDADTTALLTSYQTAFQYRNNIAHGMTVGFYLDGGVHSGYFLCPPSYASKKVKRHKPNVIYLRGASYFYNAKDLTHYADEFTKLLNEAVRIAHLINEKYNVLPLGELHP